jgi:hypothetical protein
MRMTSTAENPAPAWLWPNLLGLDAPAVAVLWQLLFSRTFEAHFPTILHVILGLSVWCIYLADRLYDTMRANITAAGTDRHRFTKRHFKPLAASLVLASALNLVLIIRHVPEKLILPGLITASLLGVYYAIRLKSGTKIATLIPREILCGMLFALGCVITPHVFISSGYDAIRFWFAAFSFGLVCSASCILISIWEREEDIATGDHSLATASPSIARHIGTAIVVVGALSLAYLNAATWRIHLAVALAAFAQLALLRFDGRLPKPLLRILADAVLLSPLVLLWG